MKNTKNPSSLPLLRKVGNWAVKLSGKAITAIQTDFEVRKNLRSKYVLHSAQLIASAQVIALGFQTIGMANNY